MSEEEKPRVRSAARAIGILLHVAQSTDGRSVKEISAALTLPRQVTYHLLHTLVETGVLRKSAQNRYVLGLATTMIAEGISRQLAPPEHLAPRVRSVAARTGETAYASGWIDGEIVVLATARGMSPVHAAEVPHGFSQDAHARASGKLLLALADPVVRAKYLQSHVMTARTPNTITTMPALEQELELSRGRRYGVELEEFSEGLCCLAVPVEISGGQMVLGISVPKERFAAAFDNNLEELRNAAKFDGMDERGS